MLHNTFSEHQQVFRTDLRLQLPWKAAGDVCFLLVFLHHFLQRLVLLFLCAFSRCSYCFIFLLFIVCFLSIGVCPCVLLKFSCSLFTCFLFKPHGPLFTPAAFTKRTLLYRNNWHHLYYRDGLQRGTCWIFHETHWAVSRRQSVFTHLFSLCSIRHFLCWFTKRWWWNCSIVLNTVCVQIFVLFQMLLSFKQSMRLKCTARKECIKSI